MTLFGLLSHTLLESTYRLKQTNPQGKKRPVVDHSGVVFSKRSSEQDGK